MNKIKELQEMVNKYKFKPRVAVNNLVFTSKGEVLLVKRNKKDALKDMWGGIGGKIEYLESAESAAIRELKEETGLKFKKPLFLGYTENISEYPHYVVLWFLHIIDKKRKIVMCKDENCDYGWFKVDELPKQIPETTRMMIKKGEEVVKSKRLLR